MKNIYKSSGLVYGNYWGGGQGAYSAKKFESNISKAHLINKNEMALNDRSLDSGMGYESLIAAVLNIETISIIEIDGKEFRNSEKEMVFIGDLNEVQQDFLENCYICKY